MRVATLVFLALSSTLAPSFLAAAGDDDAAGRALLDSLPRTSTETTRATSVAALLTAHGWDDAVTALTTLIAAGQGDDATTEMRARRHAAYDALIDANIGRGDLGRASFYASLQQLDWRNVEGDGGAALIAARRALELRQRSGDTSALWLEWSALGQCHEAVGDLREALAAHREARRLNPDPTGSAAGRIWRDVIRVTLALGDRSSAQRDVEAFRRAADGASASFRGRAWLAAADLAIASDRHREAVERTRRAIAEVAGAADGDAVRLEALGTLMLCVLDAMRVLPYADAMALAHDLDADFPQLLFRITPFARKAAQTRRRLNGELDALLREDLDRRAEARGAGDVIAEVEALRSQALTYRSLNAVGDAALVLEDAVATAAMRLNEASPPSSLELTWLDLRVALGETWLADGQTERAVAELSEVAARIDAIADPARRRSLQVARGRIPLALASALTRDQPERARTLLEAALTSGPDAPRVDRVAALRQLAELEVAAGHDDRAEQAYERAVSEAVAARDRPTELATRLATARFHLQRAGAGEDVPYERAAPHIMAARDLATRLSVRWSIARSSFLDGWLTELRGDDDGALALYQAAIVEIERMRASIDDPSRRASLVDAASSSELYQRTIALLTRQGRSAEAFEYLERAKARSFVEMLHGRRFRGGGAAIAPVDEVEQKLQQLQLMVQPENAIAVRAAGRDPAAIAAEMSGLERRLALLRSQQRLRTTRSTHAEGLVPIEFKQLSRMLASDTALVEYGLLSDQMVAFVVTRGGAQELSWPVDDKVVKRGVRRLRRLLASPTSSLEAIDQAIAVLAPLVSHPVVAALPASTRRLVVVPAGPLHHLPFQVLTTADGEPLIDRYTISYLPSASSLEMFGRRKSSKEVFLGALGNVGVDSWSPLPATLDEVARLATLYPNAVVRRELELTRRTTVAALGRTGRVHLATHGFVDEDAPLLSGLVVTPAAGEPSRLRLYDLMDVKVNAELVVLSACETGLGRLDRGEEVAGLTRTLLIAGADRVVSSLWQVADEVTADLMHVFHVRLKAGDDPATALRQASREIWERHPHPVFWAPFIITGRP